MAEAQKAADQMHAQTFNDVGKMRDEEFTVVRYKRRMP